MKLGQRISAAVSLVFKGSIAPFNKLLDIGSGSNGKKLGQPYAQSVWVQGCIGKVAQPISAVDLTFVHEGEKGEVEYSSPELTAFWRNPAKGIQGYAEFIKALVGWRKLVGEAFILMDDAMLVPFPETQKAWPKVIVARPDRMRQVMADGELIGWEFTDGQSRRHALLAEQVIHKKYWNPYDDVRGLGPLEAILIAAETDYLAGQFELNLMRNNGDTGPYVVAKGGIPDDKQREMIINQLREKRRYAQQGEFRPAFITGDITVEDPKVKTVDAAMIAGRIENRNTIAFGLGVPMSMVNVVASYSIGSASDRYALISETCMPEAADLEDGISQVAQRQTGEKMLKAKMQWDEHPIMQAVRRERIDSADKLWTKGMPMKNVNDFLGLGMKPFKGWEVGYLPINATPVESLDPAKDPALAEDDETEIPPAITEDEVEDATEKMRQALTAKSLGMVGRSVEVRLSGSDNFSAFACTHHTCTGDSGALQRARSKKEIALWKSHMSKRRETVKAYRNRFKKWLFDARSETLANLSKVKSLPGTVTKAAAADIIFDKTKFTDILLAAMRKQSIVSLKEAGDQVFDELKLDDPWQVPPAEVIAFNKARENKLKNVTDDVFDEVKGQIEEGLTAGESIAKLTDRIKSTFNGISSERAERIAMTETAAVYGEGRQVAMESAGVEYKQWLTSGNDNVRATHAAANNQIVPITEAYTVGGEQLMHPGDSNGSAANVINCHCVSIAVDGPEEEET